MKSYYDELLELKDLNHKQNLALMEGLAALYELTARNAPTIYENPTPEFKEGTYD